METKISWIVLLGLEGHESEAAATHRKGAGPQRSQATLNIT